MPTWPEKPEQRAVDIVAVSFTWDYKMNHPEVPALDEQRAAASGQRKLLHRRYVVVKDLRGEKMRPVMCMALSQRVCLLEYTASFDSTKFRGPLKVTSALSECAYKCGQRRYYNRLPSTHNYHIHSISRMVVLKVEVWGVIRMHIYLHFCIKGDFGTLLPLNVKNVMHNKKGRQTLSKVA